MMRAVSFARSGLGPAAAAAVLLLLGSCGEDGLNSGRSFQSKYAMARNALESGDYERAKRGYQGLLQEAGPLAPRLQLEYAHAELRSGDFAAAAQSAGRLAKGQHGEARGAALAVQGTAQHELGLSLLAEGKAAEGKAQLQAARSALDEVLSSHPGLDPLGSMTGRRASIDARLKNL